MTSLVRLRGENADISEEAADIKVIVSIFLPLSSQLCIYKCDAYMLLLITGLYKNTRTVEGLEDFRPVSEKIRSLAYSNFSIWFHFSTVSLQFADVLRMNLLVFKVGVGLMVLQQFGGVNAIAYYASAIFESAGKYYNYSPNSFVQEANVCLQIS